MKIVTTFAALLASFLFSTFQVDAATSTPKASCAAVVLDFSQSPDGRLRAARHDNLIQVESLITGKIFNQFSLSAGPKTTIDWHWSKDSKTVLGVIIDSSDEKAVSAFALNLTSGTVSIISGKPEGPFGFRLPLTRYRLFTVDLINETTALAEYRYDKYDPYEWHAKVFQVIDLKSGKVAAKTNKNARRGSSDWAGRNFGAFDQQLDPNEDIFRHIQPGGGNYMDVVAKRRSAYYKLAQFFDLSLRSLFTIYGDGAIEMLETTNLKLVQELAPPFTLKRGEWINNLLRIRAPDQKNIYLFAEIFGGPLPKGRVGGGQETTSRDVVFKIVLGNPASTVLVDEVTHQSDTVVHGHISVDVPFTGGLPSTKVIYAQRDRTTPRIDMSDDGSKFYVIRDQVTEVFDLK